MTKDEALKLSMEAMEITGGFDVEITAIKEALAQSEQEPVAWRAWVSKFPQGTGSDWVYVTNPIMKDKIHNQPLYTTPPQRKPLTDEELQPIADEYRILFGSWVKDFARAIEAAHGIKEKNT